MDVRLATQDTQWLKNDADEIIGIALGFDFCAEHEFGLNDLSAALALPEGEMRGLESRKIHALPKNFKFKKFKRSLKDKSKPKEDCAVLVCFATESYMGLSIDRQITQTIKAVSFWTDPGDKWYDEKKHNIIAAWDEKSFAIVVRGAANIETLKRVYEAFKRYDIVVAPGKNVGFLRSFGLTFVIDSMIDEKTRAQVLENDLEHIRLLQAAKDTGVEALLKEAGLSWYALSPAWTDSDKTQVKFFLNPCEQKRHDFGWFSVEELRAWARGEGPVMLGNS